MELWAAQSSKCSQKDMRCIYIYHILLVSCICAVFTEKPGFLSSTQKKEGKRFSSYTYTFIDVNKIQTHTNSISSESIPQKTMGHIEFSNWKFVSLPFLGKKLDDFRGPQKWMTQNGQGFCSVRLGVMNIPYPPNQLSAN